MNQPELIKVKLNQPISSMGREQLEQFVEVVSASNDYLQSEVKRYRSLLDLPEQEKLALKDELLIIKHKFYGSSSEQRPKPRDHKPEAQKQAKPKTLLPSKRYPDLPVLEDEIDLEQAPSCSLCDSGMQKMGQTEDGEYVTVTQKVFHIVKQRRQKYRCNKCHGDVKTVPAPPRLKAGSSFGDEVAIDVAVSKYCDHLPVERYARQAKRLGLTDVHPQTLIDQTHYLAEALKPVYGRLRAEVRGSAVLHADETPWKLLEGDDKKNWFLWGFFNARSSYYEAHDSRAGKVAGDFLEECQAAYLVSDAYSGYAECTKASKIKNAYCMAHARRKWIEAEPHYPEATPVIDWIGELYEIERELKNHSADMRLVGRLKRSKPLLKQINDYLLALNVLPKSSIGKARRYLLKHWQQLTRFLDDGRIPVDNNLAERGLRGPVVGRKNYYGNHSKRGAETTAILYSIIESCKLNGIDPYRYLKQTLRAILCEQPFLTPVEFAKN